MKIGKVVSNLGFVILGLSITAAHANCPPRISSGTFPVETTVVDPTEMSSCKFVVLVCNYCVYSTTGLFKEDKHEVCGVCFKGPFSNKQWEKKFR